MPSQKLIDLSAGLETAIGSNNYQKLAEIILKMYPTMFRADRYGKLDFAFGIPSEDESRAFTKILKIIDNLGEKSFEGISTLQIEKINKMHEGLADLSADRSDGWIFNQDEAKVDVDFWSKVPAWTADQAIIIAIGKDPNCMDGVYLDKWTRSVVGVLNSKDKEFIKQYVKIRDLVLCARDVGTFVFPVPPLTFVQWTKKFNIPFPQDLAAMVFSYHEEQDFKVLYEQCVTKCENLSETIKVLEWQNNELKQAKAPLQYAANTSDKMFAALVNDKFPGKKPIITNLKSALDRLAAAEDDKTINVRYIRGKELIEEDLKKDPPK